MEHIQIFWISQELVTHSWFHLETNRENLNMHTFNRNSLVELELISQQGDAIEWVFEYVSLCHIYKDWESKFPMSLFFCCFFWWVGLQPFLPPILCSLQLLTFLIYLRLPLKHHMNKGMQQNRWWWSRKQLYRILLCEKDARHSCVVSQGRYTECA